MQIPLEIIAALDPIKDNEEAVKAYGVHLGTEMCKKILAHGIKTLHLYTLNMEKSALAILKVRFVWISTISFRYMMVSEKKKKRLCNCGSTYLIMFAEPWVNR